MYCMIHIQNPVCYCPSKHFFFSKTSLRGLQRNNYSSSKGSWRRLQDVFKMCLQYVFQKRLQGVFASRLQDAFKTSSSKPQMSWRHLQEVLKTSWKTKKMLHWRNLQDVFSTSSPWRMFVGVNSDTLKHIDNLLRHFQPYCG